MPWPMIVQNRHDGDHNTPTLATGGAEAMGWESREPDPEPTSVLVTAGVEVEAESKVADLEPRDPWAVMPHFTTEESGGWPELVESPGWRPRTTR